MAKKTDELEAAVKATGERLFNHVKAELGEFCKDDRSEQFGIVQRVSYRMAEIGIKRLGADAEQKKDLDERLQMELATLANLGNEQAQAVAQAVRRGWRVLVGDLADAAEQLLPIAFKIAVGAIL